MADNETSHTDDSPPSEEPAPTSEAGVWPPPPTGGYDTPPPGRSTPPSAEFILTLGILSIVLTLFCTVAGLLGPVAWILGNQALAAMERGQADPAKRGTVNAGRVCGIIGTGLMAVIFLVGVAFLVFGGAVRSWRVR